MTTGHPSQSTPSVLIMGVSAGVAILLLGFLIRSFLGPCCASQPGGKPGLESGAAQSAASAEPGLQNASVKNDAQEFVHHADAAEPAPASVSAPAGPVRAAKKSDDFVVDYQVLRDRETGRKATIKNIREVAKENPESGYALNDEQLRKLDRSGASFQ